MQYRYAGRKRLYGLISRFRTFALSRLGPAVALLLVCGSALAETTPQQIVSQSWHGLSGLFVAPTARTIGQGKLAVGYSESKHVEVFSYSRFMDRQIRAPITYGITDRIELSACYQSNQYDVSLQPVLDNDDLVTLAAKFVVCGESGRRPALALAVRDITDSDRDAVPLRNVHNGRKFFLLASKRVVDDPIGGRFVDAHIGIGSSKRSSISPLFGFEITLSQTMSFIAEGVWDSPFINFRNAYVNTARRGTSDHEGRFILDTGLRFYPDVVPGLVIDLGVVGDSSMEFSFGVGYVFGR